MNPHEPLYFQSADGKLKFTARLAEEVSRMGILLLGKPFKVVKPGGEEVGFFVVAESERQVPDQVTLIQEGDNLIGNFTVGHIITIEPVSLRPGVGRPVIDEPLKPGVGKPIPPRSPLQPPLTVHTQTPAERKEEVKAEVKAEEKRLDNLKK